MLCLSFGGKRFGMQTMRVPVGRVPQIKHAKYLLLKVPVITLMKKMKRIQKDRN
jgi:hypothetical protein